MRTITAKYEAHGGYEAEYSATIYDNGKIGISLRDTEMAAYGSWTPEHGTVINHVYDRKLSKHYNNAKRYHKIFTLYEARMVNANAAFLYN